MMPVAKVREPSARTRSAHADSPKKMELWDEGRPRTSGNQGRKPRSGLIFCLQSGGFWGGRGALKLPGEMFNVFNEQRLIAQVAHRVVAGLPECVEDLALGDLFLHLHYSRGPRGSNRGETVRRHAPSP
jgi:hypothetical protein